MFMKCLFSVHIIVIIATFSTLNFLFCTNVLFCTCYVLCYVLCGQCSVFETYHQLSSFKHENIKKKEKEKTNRWLARVGDQATDLSLEPTQS